MLVRYRFFYGYWIALVGFVSLALTSGLIFYGFSVMNKPIADEFGWSRGKVTAAFFVFLFTVAATSPIVGQIANKRGARQVLFLGTVLLAASLILLSWTSAIWNFYLLYLCLAIGYSLLGNIPVSVVLSNWFYRLRGTIQGLVFSGMGLGGLALTPLIGNYLIPNFGWRNAYLVMALLLLVTVLPLILFVVKDHPQEKGLLAYGEEVAEVPDKNGSQMKVTEGLSLKEALGTTTFWMVVLTSAVYSMNMTAAMQNLVSILNEQGFPTSDAVVALSLVGLFTAVGRFLFGYLCDHISPKYAIAVSYAVIAFSIVIMLQAHSATHLWIYGALMGLGNGGWVPNFAMLAVSYFGLRHYGAVLGAIHLIFLTGGAIGPMIAGFTYDYIGSYRPILLVMAVLCFVSIPVIALIRKPETLSD